ncbi:MAG: TetR/AcrR family transcriptional regulator [Clostridia bacterium]|nr:TetR/AcrR family transcriptional regulator [Clostridia bacterium]
MRKGDEKRQEMLNVAERLFCLKGYEATSVQDILNVLHVSKGGFYHHFASKEALLNTLFYQRAEQALAQVEESLSKVTDVMPRLNKLIYGYLPLRKEDADFVGMLLPMLDKPEGRALRLCYQEALWETFLPVMQRELALALDADVICPAHGDMAEVALHLLNQCWVDVSVLLMASIKKAQKPETAALLSILNRYRRSLERLLDAPFGSVEIIPLQEWEDVVDKLSCRLLLPMQG